MSTRSDLPPLSGNDFAAYFTELHGQPPFPWQARLAALLADGGSWPEVLDLPTGTGKTAALDIAVFHLALAAGSATRSAPLRIVYVVDRRTIVDQAYERAEHIAQAITRANGGVLGAVRRRLASFSRDGEALPLRTALLRGGIARNDLWARSPDQPLIAVSTVDQVGSRLLFRGYGVSDAMKPIHAGLLGTDALYLLDEVHLSHPFRETLAAIAGRYATWAERSITPPIRVVEMSATPGTTHTQAFSLDVEDRAHPVLSRRLQAAKPTTLVEVAPRNFLREVEQRVRPHVAAGATVAVVVNRVATARELHARLGAALTDAEVHLLTGRMRPRDRSALEGSLFARLRAGRTRDPAQRPLVIVATQCIEAGADFDFDALVTECASLDALRQRFGRLDRLGALDGKARGVIIAQTDSLNTDPVYGTALGTTWRWLNELPSVDFGINALSVPPDAGERGLLAPTPHAPILLPSHLDAWVQTFPRPTPDPDVALWLHGPERGAADVQIVWRADLQPELLATAIDPTSLRATAAREVALGIVQALPPTSGEAMPVPFAAARRWLEGRSEPPIADVEGATEEEESNEALATTPRPAIVWRGDASTVIDAAGLRPGDTIVVPASYGGIAAGTWAPATTDPVRDIAELATLEQRGRACLRLHPGVIASLIEAADQLPAVPVPGDDEDTDDARAASDWLQAAAAQALPPDVARLISLLAREAERRAVRVERLPLSPEPAASEYLFVTARRRVRFDGDEVSTEDDEASFTGVAVPLAEHLDGVGAVAADFALRLGLPPELVADIRLAGRWHDLGKTDPRFQRLLHGGSAFRATVAPEPLAKSATPLRDWRARQDALKRSGCPRGARHELLSLAIMESVCTELAARAHDWDLVQHLVASHHGRCRPLAPWVPDPEPVDVKWSYDGLTGTCSSAHELARLDSGVGERFWLLVRRYGWWGLAWLEAILRLGDHRRSEEEQQREGG